MAAVSPLHPVRLSDIPEGGLYAAREHYEPEVMRLMGINPQARSRQTQRHGLTFDHASMAVNTFFAATTCM